MSNVEEPFCKPSQSYDDHIALPEVISIPIFAASIVHVVLMYVREL